MATLLTLKRRIKTAQNISKTTRAMQMIAASRLKNAQNAAVSSRPYVSKLTNFAVNLSPDNNSRSEILHPYMKPVNKLGRTLYLIIAPDKGLCAGLITNVIREYFKVKSDNSYFITVGKKIEGVVGSTTKNLIASFPFGTTLPTYEAVYPLTKLIDEHFLGGKVDNVKIITSHFHSVFLQSPSILNLLPVVLFEDKEKIKKPNDSLIEPSSEEILPSLLKRYIEMNIYQALLESFASEQGARMIAMQNATNNAKDIVDDLTLLYNKARQERITKEILDISGAAAILNQ